MILLIKYLLYLSFLINTVEQIVTYSSTDFDEEKKLEIKKPTERKNHTETQVSL